MSTLNPLTISDLAAPGEPVEFWAYDDYDKNGPEFLERVTSDANGVVTLGVAVPAGKVLWASVEAEDGADTYSKGRFFTDNF